MRLDPRPGSRREIRVRDFSPARARFLADVLEGLSRPRKTIPCKYFYDARGSRLFDRICELEEYYVTRTELSIMDAHAGEMAAAIGPRCLLIEYGPGSGRKTRLLLDHLDDPVAYVPIDISSDALTRFAHSLAIECPGLEVLPIVGDYTAGFKTPPSDRPPSRRVVYFPGSTIGNLESPEAVRLLARAAESAGRDGGLLIGVDLKKDLGVLEAAYNDGPGVTAAFNLNLLIRINRELGADFRTDRFRHRAVWNEREGRMEMHLVSLVDQGVRIGTRQIHFAKDETIFTESCYKYSLGQFAGLSARAGWTLERVWTDPRRWFSVQYLRAS